MAAVSASRRLLSRFVATSLSSSSAGWTSSITSSVFQPNLRKNSRWIGSSSFSSSSSSFRSPSWTHHPSSSSSTSRPSWAHHPSSLSPGVGFAKFSTAANIKRLEKRRLPRVKSEDTAALIKTVVLLERGIPSQPADEITKVIIEGIIYGLLLYQLGFITVSWNGHRHETSRTERILEEIKSWFWNGSRHEASRTERFLEEIKSWF